MGQYVGKIALALICVLVVLGACVESYNNGRGAALLKVSEPICLEAGDGVVINSGTGGLQSMCHWLEFQVTVVETEEEVTIRFKNTGLRFNVGCDGMACHSTKTPLTAGTYIVWYDSELHGLVLDFKE